MRSQQSFEEYRKQREREAARVDWYDRQQAKKDALRYDCPTCGKKRLNPCHEEDWLVVCDARFQKALRDNR